MDNSGDSLLQELVPSVYFRLFFICFQQRGKFQVYSIATRRTSDPWTFEWTYSRDFSTPSHFVRHVWDVKQKSLHLGVSWLGSIFGNVSTIDFPDNCGKKSSAYCERLWLWPVVNHDACKYFLRDGLTDEDRRVRFKERDASKRTIVSGFYLDGTWRLPSI